MPSLHVEYQRCRIKRYHKEGQALRTETTINDSQDLGVGRALQNLPRLRQIGFTANRPLLDVQTISQDCALGQAAFGQLNRPVQIDESTECGPGMQWLVARKPSAPAHH